MERGEHMTEVVAALIWQGERFMICQRPAHKARGMLWEFVGGKVEPGESKEQALVRECREELAVEVAYISRHYSSPYAVSRLHCPRGAPEAGAQRYPLHYGG